MTQARENYGIDAPTAVHNSGCGRGLVAVAAARRVPQGKVTDVDIWQEIDLAGNTPDAIHANAKAAGVDDRLTVKTGDARSLPFPDESFDVVASRINGPILLWGPLVWRFSAIEPPRVRANERRFTPAVRAMARRDRIAWSARPRTRAGRRGRRFSAPSRPS